MHLFGAANWWLPRWLDRLLPKVRIEGDGNLTALESYEGGTNDA
jgi:RND superfamily putative drug exporter